MFKLLSSSYLLPGLYRALRERANGCKNVGKWGFPLPNQSPAKIQFILLNLEINEK